MAKQAIQNNATAPIMLPALNLIVREVSWPENKVTTVRTKNPICGEVSREETKEVPFSARLSIVENSDKKDLAALEITRDTAYDMTINLSISGNKLKAEISYVWTFEEKRMEEVAVGEYLLHRKGEEYAPYTRATEDEYATEYKEMEVTHTHKQQYKDDVILKGPAFAAVYHGLRNAAAKGKENCAELVAFIENECPDDVKEAKGIISSRIEGEIISRKRAIEEITKDIDLFGELMKEVGFPADKRSSAMP